MLLDTSEELKVERTKQSTASIEINEEGLEREYRKKRDLVIYWIRREWEVKNSLKLEEKEKAKFYSDFERKLIISKPRRNRKGADRRNNI